MFDLGERRTCLECGNVGLCALDCGLAPWSFDRPYTANPFLLMLRQRRWVKSPVDRQEISFRYQRIDGYREARGTRGTSRW